MKTQWDIDSLYEYAEKGLITGREHPSLPLAVWNYTAETQYGRLWDEVTLQTRGLVTHGETGRVVAPCIPKFFNLSEPQNDGLTVEDFDVAQEKLDGSLIHVFNYEGQWVCSSRGSFESDQAKWAQELVDSKPKWFLDTYDEDVSFVCELIHPDNRIVVDYGDERSLRLITSFAYVDPAGHKTLPPGWHEFAAANWEWPWSKVRTFNTEEALEYLDNSGIEGVVLIGDNGRAKIKTQEYVEHHRIVTGLTTKSVLQHYIEHGDVEKLLEVAPDEWYGRIGELAWKFDDRVNFLKTHVTGQYMRVRQSFGRDMTRKDFALAVKGQRNTKYLFNMLDGKDITPLAQREVFDNYERYGLEL